MIPVEAVEAADAAFWNDEDTNSLASMRKALEAAAPYMSSAWHDAVAEAYVEGALSAEQANVMWNKNPYKK